MYTIQVSKYKKDFEQPVLLMDLANSLHINALAGKVNGRLRELSYYVYGDAIVEFVDENNSEAIKIYEATLRYMLLKVLFELFPSKKVIVSNFVSRTVKFHISHYKVTNEDLLKVKERLNDLIARNVPIIKKRINKEELIENYRFQNYFEQIKLLENKDEALCTVYECEGYYNYMFSWMLPSTGYIKKYELSTYDPGFIVQYPRSEEHGIIPEFEENETFKNTIEEQSRWTKQIGLRNLNNLNEITNTRDKMVNLVNICETRHNDSLCRLGDAIEAKKESIQLIAIAGPSSSGKTTFCNRLRIELLTRGIRPLMISIDDYYRNREEYPKDEDGNLDYEHIESLNIELFNEHLSKLIQGEEIELPCFDFDKGRSGKSGKFIKLEKGQPILIEGIHALNERLTNAISREHKFKIFISPHSMHNFDNHNPCSATDLRLLRRIVRDKLFRGASPEHTLALWNNVRKGEFKWIYPFSNEADFTFNTELTYEIMVLRKYALPSLLMVKKTSPCYVIVRSLIDLLTNIRDIEDKYVPCNSILREFIGGSCFYDN